MAHCSNLGSPGTLVLQRVILAQGGGGQQELKEFNMLAVLNRDLIVGQKGLDLAGSRIHKNIDT